MAWGTPKRRCAAHLALLQQVVVLCFTLPSIAYSFQPVVRPRPSKRQPLTTTTGGGGVGVQGSAGAHTSPLFRRPSPNRLDAFTRSTDNEIHPDTKARRLSFRRLFQRRRGGSASVLKSTATTADTSSISLSTTEKDNPSSDDDVGAQLGAWIPIASTSALQNLGPQQITVMGRDLVIWQNSKSDEWSVMTDECPHRLAPLSQGRVDDETGCLECPYHGWQFDSEGTLRKIPQLEEGRRLDSLGDKGNVQSLPTHQMGDLLFAFFPTSVHGESYPRSLLPEQMYNPYVQGALERNATYLARDLPYSYDFLVENFMDPAHIPYAHNSLQGTREDAMPINMSVLVSNFSHVEVTFMDQTRGKIRDGVVSFQRPSLYHYRLRDDNDDDNSGTFKPRLVILIVPIKPGYARVFLPSFFPKWVPTWLQHAATNRFLNTDIWLHDAERMALRRKIQQDDTNNDTENTNDIDATTTKKQLPYMYMTESDNGVRYFRRWYEKDSNLMNSAPKNTFGPSRYDDLPTQALTRREQIDPWVHHSKHCSKCRTALKRMKQIQWGGLVLAACAAIFGGSGKQHPIRAMIMAALGLYVSHITKKLATVIEGNPYPSGVDDRSVAALK